MAKIITLTNDKRDELAKNLKRYDKFIKRRLVGEDYQQGFVVYLMKVSKYYDPFKNSYILSRAIRRYLHEFVVLASAKKRSGTTVPYDDGIGYHGLG